MEETHLIEWIEWIEGGKVLRQNLKPGDAPTATFAGATVGDGTARAYCNLHGLWKS